VIEFQIAAYYSPRICNGWVWNCNQAVKYQQLTTKEVFFHYFLLTEAYRIEENDSCLFTTVEPLCFICQAVNNLMMGNISEQNVSTYAFKCSNTLHIELFHLVSERPTSTWHRMSATGCNWSYVCVLLLDTLLWLSHDL